MEKEAYRSYIQLRTNLGMRPVDIHAELVELCGDDAVSYNTVCTWAKRFREETMEIEDMPRPGRPITKITPENIELVRSLINEDPHSTIDDLEAETSLSHGTIFTIIHEHLEMRKITSRWVPHKLTLKQKQERVKICKENLKLFQSNSWRLCDIITGDETWIYFRQIGRKAANSSWVNQEESPKTVIRRSKDEPKRLFSIFFKANGWLYLHAFERGCTVDRFSYIRDCLKPVVNILLKERPKSGTRGIKLLHDGARAHNNQEVLNYLNDVGLDLMPHPAYSPDLAPCDFWLNDYIKRNLIDQKDEKALFKSVTKLLNSIPQEEYKKTFEMLLIRMQMCINNRGDYFEHLM